jgi:predicted hotdog family 3-hydroxylacyl-ACP dehydratase
VSHRDPCNPLKRGGRLDAICGIEYGLQAMAVHGALLDGTPHRPGFLSSLRNIEIVECNLAMLAAPLQVEADLLLRENRGLIYRFSISAGGTCYVGGQASIMIPAAPGEER